MPATPAPAPPDPAMVEAETRAILAAHDGLEGPLLPVLHALHARFGHLPPAALPVIAAALGLGRAEVHGVASFYHDFRRQPAGRRVIRLCRAEACQAVGGQALADHAQARLGIGWGETTPDGRVTLEPVFCLGLCACGPAALVDGAVAGRLTAEAFDRLVEGA
jgi:formate dehydrogenase subunit gamma